MYALYIQPDVKGIELDMKQASNGLSMVWSFDVVRETEDQRSGDNNEENNNSNDVNTNYGNNNDTNNDNNIDNGDSSGITPENSSGQTGEEADAEADGEYIHAASSSSRREQFSRMLRQSQEIVDCGDGVHVYIGKDAFLKVLGATVDFDTAEMRLKVLDREGNELHAG